MSSVGAIIFGVLVLAVTPGHTPGSDLPGEQVAQDPGKAIYTTKGLCFVCHGPAGEGTALAPALADSAWLNFEERPALEQLQKLVKEGVPNPVEYDAPMPPMGGAQLSEAEITAVAEYVLKLSAPPAN
jgi:mono/diheme cytochrome c family protein